MLLHAMPATTSCAVMYLVMHLQPQSGEKRRLDSLAATLQLLQQQLLPALSAAGGWQPDQVQLLGFSQGGTVALELARRCRGSQRLGG
jgi:surfactin synthase thioesterase subunit